MFTYNPNDTIGIAAALNPTTITAETATPAVVLKDARNVMFIVNIGAVSGGTYTVKLQTSADGNTWVDAPGKAFPSTSAANVQRALTYNADLFPQNHNRVRCVITPSGTSPSITVSAVAITTTNRYDPYPHISTVAVL